MYSRSIVCITLLIPVMCGCSSGDDGTATPPPGSGADASSDVVVDTSAETAADAPSDGNLADVACFPQTCATLEADCGTALDGCGGTIECGSCDEGEVCGADGPNRCGAGKCEPKSCEAAGAECGWTSDGCSGVLNCGGCPPPSVCEGKGTPNQCECISATCAEAGAECGTVPDGCGGVIECGECEGGETCGGGGPNECGTAPCSPKSCAQLAASCGYISDGCATAIDCGSCEEPNTCGGGGVANECGCLAKSCAQLGASCGMLDTGCGLEDCGTCTAPDTCGGGGVANVCGCACSRPHAITTCEAGVCEIIGCSAGWGDCNGSSNDGCESNFSSDVNHCGACGNGCYFPHASGSCNGQCSMGACEPYYADCDSSAANGCETQTGTDPANCGYCGNVCSLPNASHQACSAGTCMVAGCSIGWGDCDGYGYNGCEISLTTASDCGGCGVTCGDGESCVNGVCRCGSGWGCGATQYCHAGGCYDLPTMTWTPICMDLGVDHAAPDYTFDFKIYGRPGATAQKYNRHVSCSQPAYAAETYVIGPMGWYGETFESGAVGCIETTGLWETWVVVDGHETNHVFATFYSSSCSGAATCNQAASYCWQ